MAKSKKIFLLFIYFSPIFPIGVDSVGAASICATEVVPLLFSDGGIKWATDS